MDEKYLHLFENKNNFQDAYNGSAYHEPWVSFTEDTNEVNYNKTPIDLSIFFDTRALLSQGDYFSNDSLCVKLKEERKPLFPQAEYTAFDVTASTSYTTSVLTRKEGYGDDFFDELLENNGGFSYDKRAQMGEMTVKKTSLSTKTEGALLEGYPCEKVVSNYQLPEHDQFNITTETRYSQPNSSFFYLYDFSTMECIVVENTTTDGTLTGPQGIITEPEGPISTEGFSLNLTWSQRPVTQRQNPLHSVSSINNETMEQITTLIDFDGNNAQNFPVGPFLDEDFMTVEIMEDKVSGDLALIHEPPSAIKVAITTTPLLDNSKNDYHRYIQEIGYGSTVELYINEDEKPIIFENVTGGELMYNADLKTFNLPVEEETHEEL